MVNGSLHLDSDSDADIPRSLIRYLPSDGNQALKWCLSHCVDARDIKPDANKLYGRVIKHLVAKQHFFGIDLVDSLIHEVSNGRETSVRILIENGVDPNLRDGDGGTLLHHAVHSGYKDVAKRRSKYGSCVDVDNPPDMKFSMFPSPHREAPWRRAATVCVLLDHGADPNSADGRGYTPLHYACTTGRYDIVELLIEYGAGLNVRTPAGETALLLCLAKLEMKRQSDIVELLVKSGADVNCHDTDGVTGLEWAARDKRGCLVHYLLEQGAEYAPVLQRVTRTRNREARKFLMRAKRSMAKQNLAAFF